LEEQQNPWLPDLEPVVDTGLITGSSMTTGISRGGGAGAGSMTVTQEVDVGTVTMTGLVAGSSMITGMPRGGGAA